MFGWFKKRVEQRKVEFQMKVPAYISSCDLLDVHSQGRSEKEALDNLVEALQLFVETCYEQGTLEQVLKAQGLLPGGGDERFSSDEHTLEVPLGLIARQHAAHAH
jgi:predicted ATP-grasp superfamily ATP-dependent carboligase